MQPTSSNDPQTEADIEYVVREMSGYTRRDEIKQAIMQRRSVSWDEAEHFVQYVEANYSTVAAARQTPLQIALGCITLIFGTVLFCCTSRYLLSWSRMAAYGDINPLHLLRGFVLNPFALLILTVTLFVLWRGFLMIGGSIVGFWQTFRALLK